MREPIEKCILNYSLTIVLVFGYDFICYIIFNYKLYVLYTSGVSFHHKSCHSSSSTENNDLYNNKLPNVWRNLN
jgi:hypothetical protein